MPIILAAAALAAAVAVLRGGSLDTLAETKFRWGVLLFVGLGLQVAFDAWRPSWLTERRSLFFLLLSNAAVALFLAMNRHLPGILLAVVGLALNAMVIAANGAMPVSQWAAEQAHVPFSEEAAGLKHERLDAATRLPWLGDAVPLPRLHMVISAGDVVLALGVARLVYARTSARRSKPLHSPRSAPS